VFQIDGVAGRADGSLAVDLTVFPIPVDPTVNLLANPSVEAGAQAWTVGGWHPELATFAWTGPGANGSAHSLSISAPSENDVEWTTHVTGVEAGRGYYACGFLKGDHVVGGAGATVSVSGTFTHSTSLHGSFDWTRRCTAIQAAGPTIDLACRLGSFAATTSGTMWCDDLSLVPLDSAFAPRP
jgi:hypothetical protein